MNSDDALPSWRDGAAKTALLDLIRSVTEPGDGFVPADERIVTFDNDGTLWCEKPMYPQADFLLRRWAEQARPTRRGRRINRGRPLSRAIVRGSPRSWITFPSSSTA